MSQECGLKCVPACGDCRGETCNNSEQIIVDQKTLESDDEYNERFIVNIIFANKIF